MVKFIESPIYSRIVNGTFWTLTGVAIGKVCVLLASIVCAHLLGSASFGEFGLVRSTIMTFIVLGSAGLGTTASKYIAEYRAINNTEGIIHVYVLTNALALVFALVFALATFFFAGLISESLFHNFQLASSIRVGSLLLLFSIINAAQNGVLSGFEKFQTIAVNTFISSVVESLGIIAGAYLGGVEGAILGYGISFLFWTTINYFSIKKTFLENGINRHYVKLTRADWSILWSFSIPSSLNSIMVAPSYWMIKSMLVKFTDYGELGIYEAADQWKIIILFVPSAIANILLPIFSNVNGHNNQKTYFKVLKTSIILNGLIAFMLVAFIYIGKELIMGLYGVGFNNPNMLFVLCSSTVFSAMAQVMTLSLISQSKAWISFAFNFVWAVILIGSSYILLEKEYGVISLAWANLFAYFFHFLLLFGYFYYTQKISPHLYNSAFPEKQI